MPVRHGRGVRHGSGARDCLGSLGTVPMPFRHGRGACRTAWSLRLLDGNLDDREPAKAGKLPDFQTISCHNTCALNVICRKGKT